MFTSGMVEVTCFLQGSAECRRLYFSKNASALQVASFFFFFLICNCIMELNGS